ncbi:hypothetical protein [Saccharopolyspora spinosa]|uniref:hypothetical protein n=1 Tax=Saccharopolyspora spinosa TaxID=60894 RepID=UPI0004971956|nr:hypothetical protein [Saccharopolyspora spinosa]
MRLFDWFTGTKRPSGGVPPQSVEVVRAALLGVNSPDRPFMVRDGRSDGVDLVAEWKIADAHWYGYFGNVTTINRTLMRLDPSKHEVRSLDQEWSVTWAGGTPRLTLATRYARGQINKKSCSATFMRDEQGKLVKESQRKFSTGELKPPLEEAVTGAGWTWRGLVIGKL